MSVIRVSQRHFVAVSLKTIYVCKALRSQFDDASPSARSLPSKGVGLISMHRLYTGPKITSKQGGGGFKS